MYTQAQFVRVQERVQQASWLCLLSALLDMDNVFLTFSAVFSMKALKGGKQPVTVPHKAVRSSFSVKSKAVLFEC